MQHAIIYALIEIGDLESAVRANQHMAARRAKFVVLDQIGYRVQCHTAMAIFTDDPEYRAISLWLFRRHPEWGAELVEKVLHLLRVHRPSAEERAEFIGFLARAAKDPASQKVLATRLTEPEFNIDRGPVLEAMARSGLKELPDRWVDALLQLMGEADNRHLAHILLVLRNVQAPKGRADALANAVASSQGPHPGAEIRTSAIAALSRLGRGLDATTFAALVGGIQTDRTAQVGGLAAEVISKARLTTDQLQLLIAALPKVGPLELDRVLTAFAQTRDEAIGKKLVAALNNPALRSSLRADGVKERIKHFGPAVQKEAEKLYAALNAEYEQQRTRLEQVAKTLWPGDVRRGQAVFNSAKTSCIACHTIGYVGGKIGPDLTRIGNIRQERDLLEAILFPSASFVRSYEPLTVRTRDGRVFSGVPKKDAPDEIVLVLAADKEQRIPREDVEDVQPGKVSIMPAGLDKQLTEQELADLIAFLKACR